MAQRITFNKRGSQSELDGFSNFADEFWNEALQYYQDRDGWKVNKEGPDGAVIYAKKSKKGKTVFKLEGTANLDPASFYKKFFSIEEAEDTPSWNPTMQLVQVLQGIDPGTHLCYQVTAATGPGGMVSARDFVLLRRMRKLDSDKFVLCYSSVNLPDVPAVKNIVRGESFPSIAVVEACPDGDPTRMLLTWVIDLDMKLSYVPTAIFNQIFQYLLLDNMKSIRERCEELRRQQQQQHGAAAEN